MTRVVRRRTRHLRRPRRYPTTAATIAGQSISLIGTWMQMTAQAWLVLEPHPLEHRARRDRRAADAAGAAAGPLRRRDRRPRRQAQADDRAAERDGRAGAGARAADRHRRSSGSGRSACSPRCSGLNNAFENPSRQSFMLELVGPEHLRNAVSLNSVLVNVARSIGPAVAGILIATVGDGVCFLVNAASFVAVVVSLITMDTTALSPVRAGAARPGPAARGPALRPLDARARHPAGDDGRRRLPDLRVPGVAAGHGRPGPARRRRRLRLHDRARWASARWSADCSSPPAARPGCGRWSLRALRVRRRARRSPRSRPAWPSS